MPPESPAEEDRWMDDDEELPRRPRRRLLAPLPLALLGALLIALGFIGGVLVEKGQTSSSSSSSATAGLASRFAALRSGAAGTGASSGGSSAAAAGAGAFPGGGFGGAAGATSGQVAYITGTTLYVTTAEGNTVKVATSAGSTVTKTVKASVASIHPGETVLVTGATGPGGAVTAESIRVGSASATGRSLLGGGAGGSGSGTGSSTGSEQSLFGKG